MSSELTHYGVKGMRWGVRKDDRPSGRERKARKFDAKAANAQTQIDTIKASKNLNLAQQKAIKELTSDKEKFEKNAQLKREGKLTRGEKALIIGAGVVAAYSLYKVADSGEFNRLAMKGAQLMGKQQGESPWKVDLRLAKKDLSADSLQLMASRINPDFGAIGTKMNCRRCTFSYEMMRRGYDVKATRSMSATGQTLIGLHNATSQDTIRGGVLGVLANIPKANQKLSRFGGNPWGSNRISVSVDDSATSAANIFKALSTQPNGARGELGMQWSIGGGHSMAWEIVKGKPVIFDVQSNDRYENAADFLKKTKMIKNAGFTRLDNVELNPDFLMKWVQNA